MACEKIFTDIAARGLSKVGMISGTDGFGASMRQQCLDVVGDFPIEIVADETYGPSDADMTPQLTRIRNTDGVQAVINPGFGQGPAIVTRNYAQLGIDLPFYQSHGVASDAFIDLAGDAANGVRLPGTALLVAHLLDQSDPQYQVVTDYKTAFESRFEQPVSTFGGYAHDGFWLMVEAIRAAGSTDGNAVRDALEATSGWVGVTGEFTMSPEDHMGLDLSAFRLLEIVDGGWTIVD
jgi:branched-chain amino acid transport system substrate-binding protein